MPMNTLSRSRSRSQRGSVLLFSLITLTILLISAVALTRSFNTSLFNAGNLAFKRDLQNQGERVVPGVLALMRTGALATSTSRANASVANNYSATILATNARGIPNALIDDTTFASVGSSANDVAVTDQAVTVRYMVDRLCSTTGLDSTLGSAKCTMADGTNSSGGDARGLVQPPAPPAGVVYRLSIRVTGPRNTQAFFQTTFSL